MAWWRRDPALWCRSPIHRYSRYNLRDHEAAIRTRCFSRTPPSAAQHKDDDDGNRPPGLSSLELMQLQHYRRWRKKLREDPYHALFGASNDMLNGKGLKDWEWVHKSFPKWMIQEMNLGNWVNKFKKETDAEDGHARSYGKREEAQQSSSSTEHTTDRATLATETYPKKVDVSSGNPPKKRESLFPEPSFRTSRFERKEWLSGVISPSDQRRPPEPSFPKEPSKALDTIILHKGDTLGGQEVNWTPKNSSTEEVTPREDSYRLDNTTSEEPVTRNDSNPSSKEASVRESLFINEFLENDRGQEPTIDRDSVKSKDWRQTVVERRASPGFIPKPRLQKSDPIIIEASVRSRTEKHDDESETQSSPASFDEPFWTATSKDQYSTKEPQPIPSSQFPGDHLSQSVLKSSTDQGEGLLQLEPNVTRRNTDLGGTKSPPRVTSAILSQLPKDDIDFLTADNIRASMGSRKHAQQSTGNWKESRQKLEKDFNDAHEKEWTLDPLVESKIINDQHVRRTERELRQAQKTHEAEQGVPAEATTDKPLSSEAQLETSVDRMTRWLQSSGGVFSRHFWQDPVQESAINSTDPLVKGIVSGLQKGRRAMKCITDDLQTDLPPCKLLLERLKTDEVALDHAISAILRTPHKSVLREEIDEMRGNYRDIVQKLRRAITQTDAEFKEACKTLDDISVNSNITASATFKQRLRNASEILEKNTKLTRMMLFGLQARLESKPPDFAVEALFRDLGHRLLALRDTQLALTKLVGRSMQIYGITPTSTQKELGPEKLKDSGVTTSLSTSEAPTSQSVQGPDTQTLRAAAANKKLEDEIQAQKSAMHKLYDRFPGVPKSTPKKWLDMPNPLAHSRFRPFESKFKSLGKDLDEEVERAKEVVKKTLEDRKLVKEIKKAYEDTYGLITVYHRQAKSNEATSAGEAKEELPPTSGSSQKSPCGPIVNPSPTVEVTITKEIDPLQTQPNEEQEVSPIPTPATESESPATSKAHNDGAETSTTSYEPPSPKETPHTSIAQNASAVANKTTEPITLIEKKEDIDAIEDAAKTTSSEEVLATLPTHFQILTYDAQKDELSITTSTTPPPRDPSPSVPLHQALATLDNPAKFIPHITAAFEVVSAKRDMLVLRDSLSNSETCLETRTFSPSLETGGGEDIRKVINPIDGTTRLSPTGFSGDGVGVDELERDFEERRRMADEHSKKFGERDEGRRSSWQKVRKEKQGGGAVGVFKTAIVAGAVCYVFGVVGEIVK